MQSLQAIIMPTLYLVATPIGNLEDVTLRGLNVLRNVSLVAAEDTRKTRRLFVKYEITTSLISYHEHNRKLRTPQILEALKDGDVALVSEAGMPGINDPGYDLIRAAIDNDINVVPVPGPSAIMTALAICGFTAEQFVHIGFLPRKTGARKKLLQSVVDQSRTIVAFESPHRLLSALSDIQEVAGDRQMAVCREMSKIYEEVFRGTAGEAIRYFQKPKGEFTLVLEGKQRAKSGKQDRDLP